MAHDLIERYVEALSQHLRGLWPTRARVLGEVREHLREAAERASSEGLDPEAAQRSAIERFGPPATIARQFAEQRLASRLEATLRWFGWALLVLACTSGLEALFPVALPEPAWVNGEPSRIILEVPNEPVAAVMMTTGGWALELIGVLLFLAALRVQRENPLTATRLWSFALTTSVLGVGGIGFGRHLTRLVLTHADCSGAPMLLRTVAILGVFAASLPLLVAHEAQRAARALPQK